MARDYKTEYRRRVERGHALGLTRSQARGHARAGETPARTRKTVSPAESEQLENALKLLRSTDNQSYAARSVGISAERFRRFLGENKLARRAGRRWQITDLRPRELPAFVDGKYRTLVVAGFDPASAIGQHSAAVRTFLDTNNPAVLKPFVGWEITDASGRAHTLETDPNTLYRLAAAGSETFEYVYRLVT